MSEPPAARTDMVALQQRLLKADHVFELVAVELAARIDRQRRVVDKIVMSAPAPDGVIALQRKSGWINLPVTTGAGGILPMFFEPLT